METSEGYLKVIAQKIIKQKDNWKDNPNKYTALFNVMVAVLSPQQRHDFNSQIELFIENNYNLSPEIAEKICFQFYFSSEKVYINHRVASRDGGFDQITRVWVNPVQMERGLRNLYIWLLVKFKEICNEQGVKFDESELSVSDIQLGALSTL